MICICHYMQLSFISVRLSLTNMYTLQKETQHDFDRLNLFNRGIIFYMLGIMSKHVYLYFYWYQYLICFDCFSETCAGRVHWGQCQKLNVAKLHRNRSYQFVYGLMFIMLGIMRTPVYFLFLLVPYLFWLLHYTTCTVLEKWGQCQKLNVAKLHQYLKFSMMFCFGRFR